MAHYTFCSPTGAIGSVPSGVPNHDVGFTQGGELEFVRAETNVSTRAQARLLARRAAKKEKILPRYHRPRF